MALQIYLFLSLFVSLSVVTAESFDCIGEACHLGHDSCRITFQVNWQTGLSTKTGACERLGHNGHNHHDNLCNDIIGHIHTNHLIAIQRECFCDNAECVQRLEKAIQVTQHHKETHAPHPTTSIATTAAASMTTTTTTTVSVSHSANYDCLGHNCHHDAACEISFKTTSLFNTPLSTTGHCNRHDNHHNLQTCESLIGQLHKNQVYDTICLCYNAECVQRFVTATTITTHPPKVTHATHPTTIPTTTPTTIPTNATTTAATTTAASSTTTVSTTADWCIDTDPKCSDPSYQQYLCPSTELAARSFNIEFCPKACNLCTEYLEFLRTRTTTPPTSTFGVHVCADSDDKCTDMFYQAVNCTSTDPDIHRFNVERCPVSCNLCEEYYVRYPTQAPPTTAPPCVDTTSKCTDPIYKNLICNTTNPDTQAYALKTCPVSCNLCPKEAVSTTEAPPCEDTTTKCLDPVYKSLICDTSNPDTKAYAAATCPKSCNLCPTSNTPDVPKEAFGK